MSDDAQRESLAELHRRLRSRRPPLVMALAEDAKMFSYHRGEPVPLEGGAANWLNALRLAWAADDYLGVALYRVRTALQDRGIPIIPRLIHWFSAAAFGIRIGDYVALREGAYIPHGQVVIDGIVVIGRRCVLAPWTTLGVAQGNPTGPELADGVFVGTGAKVLGQVRIGANARIGANSVVVDDVPAGATAIGVPARIVEQGDALPE